MSEIKFKLLQSALEPYKTLLQTMDKSGAAGQTFDLRITLRKNDSYDSLIFELSRTGAYGIAEVRDGVVVEEGVDQSILLSSSAFNGLPLNLVETEPISFKVTDRIYCVYPSSSQMEAIKFDFEYSDNPGIFQVRTPVQPQAGFNLDAVRQLGTYIDSASNYVFKKRSDEAMSAIHTVFSPEGLMYIEATTGNEAFYAETKIEGYTNLQQNEISSLLQPSIWHAGLSLSYRQKKELYVGMDAESITFICGSVVFTHNVTTFSEYPTIGQQIKQWIAGSTYESFVAKIDPKSFKEKLQYLETIGLAARAMEPSFIMSNDQGKPYIQLKGFNSSGSSRLIDPNIISVNWVNEEAKIKLPARLLISILTTAELHGLTNFYDLQNSPGVFFVNAHNTCFILMSQEV